MKTVGRRSAFLYALIVAFCAGVCFLVVKMAINGSAWSSMPYNAHLSEGGSASSRATIVDRNGTVLFSDTNGYDDNTKEALVHVLGDKDGYISTGILKMYTSNLSGYNFFTGLSSVNGLKNGVTATLTVDSKVCEKAYELLGSKNGAVFIYNYKTGDVICQTSTPSFDPENVPTDIDTNSAYEGAFLDKTISCTFTPGSIFKIVTTACAIENMPNWQDFTADCEGSCDIDGSTVTCLDKHGTIGIEDALKYSCNIVFAKLALELGQDKLMKTASELGFGKTFKYELSNTIASKFDLSGADDIDTAWSGVGQYTDLVSPYHMAVLLGSIANGGTSATPHIVNKIVSPLGIPTLTSSSSNMNSFMNKSTADTIKSLLRNNVENYYGDSMFPGMNVCAKTGTAQVGDGKSDTAWMVGFSENDKTPYAFAVVVEEGGSGYKAAGSIASELMQMLS